MRGKIGTSGWTMGKFLSVILLVVVLILVIFGLTTNSFGPLKDRLVGMSDSVLLLFGFGDSGGSGGECFISKGVEIAPDIKGEFRACDGYCQIGLDRSVYRGKGSFKYRGLGDFTYYDKPNWPPVFLKSVYLSDGVDWESAPKLKLLYHALVEHVKKNSGK